MPVPRRQLVAVVVALVLAVLVASPASAARRLYAPTHRPKAGMRWPIRITVRDARGHAVRGTVRYAFLYQGEVVLRQDPKVDRTFVGVFRDRHLAWSKRTIGLALTFRAVVDTRLGQANLDYPVKVHR
jgi:hypothetical protein